MKLLSIIALFVFSFQIANAKSITLTTKNSCTLDQQVDSNSMRKLKACLVDKVILRRGRNYPIYLYLNSPGGNIYEGLRFISFAKTIKNLHTITEFSASMAAAIAQGIPGKRYVVEHGVFMFHRASGSFRGQFEGGELESRLRMWKKIVRNMEKMQAKRIGITLKEYKKRRKDEWWLYGSENTEQNTADEMVSVKCTAKLAEKKVKRKVRTLFGSYEYEQSLCPLVN
jgi:ATP-dependent protease ClpP protease subunit